MDNNKDIVHYFRDLSINVYNNYILELITELLYINFEQFHTSIGQIQGSESVTAINVLDDNIFKY